MLIKNLKLKNFRNIESCDLDLSYKQIILKGENGQGKTNILEALYMLCYGSSFRTSDIKQTIKHGTEYAYLKCEFENYQQFSQICEFSYNFEKKQIKIDGNEIKDRKELLYNLPCIVFSHDDIEFVRGKPEFRRHFVDQTITMYDSVYFDGLRRYKQVLRQRNAALREEKYSLLEIYDLQLAMLAVPLIKERKKFCDMFSLIFPQIYEAVSQEDRKINIDYKPSWQVDMNQELIVEKLYNQRENDIKQKTTTSGIQRDRYVLTDKNGLFADTASTGQMRLASLVFRSAQAEFYRQKTEKDPIFLIDDVLLELDSGKRAKYLNTLGNYSQAFFTFLPDEKYFETMLSTDNSQIYTVKNGNIRLSQISDFMLE